MSSNRDRQLPKALETTNSLNYWQGTVGVIITGASKGFGQAIIKVLVKLNQELRSNNPNLVYDLNLLLTARSEQLLSKLKGEMLAANKDVNVEYVAGDLALDSTVSELSNKMESFKQLKKFDHLILIHNAGSLGNVNKSVNDYGISEMNELKTYFALNVVSLFPLTATFVKCFDSVPKKTVVNISSLAALTAFKGLSTYCTGKAARDAIFRNLAIEREDVRVLSYAPGPMVTDMTEQLKEGSMGDFFRNPDNLLLPETSVNVMLYVLAKDEYKSGDHVDVFDVI